MGEIAQVVDPGFHPLQYINSVWWGLPAIRAFWEGGGKERDARVQGRPWPRREFEANLDGERPFQ